MTKLKIIQKIKKMMRHARSCRLINRHGEAQNFERMIEEWREKFNIREEIPLEDAFDFDPGEGYFAEYVFQINSPLFRNKPVRWQEQLFSPCARYFDCKPLKHRATNMKVVVGEKENRKNAIEAYLYFHELAEKTAGEYVNALKDRGIVLNSKNYRTFHNSFLMGFAVTDRLFHLKNAENQLKQLQAYVGITDAPQLAGAGESTALVKSMRIAVTEQVIPNFDSQDDTGTVDQEKNAALDEMSYLDGMESGARSKLPEKIIEIAIALGKKLEEAEELARRKRDEEIRRKSWGFNFRYGGFTPSSTTRSTYYGSPFSQQSFSFEENDDENLSGE